MHFKAIHIYVEDLAFCHAPYHACVKDPVCTAENGVPRSSHIAEKRASEIVIMSYTLLVADDLAPEVE